MTLRGKLLFLTLSLGCLLVSCAVCPKYDATRVFATVPVEEHDVQVAITLAGMSYLGKDSDPAGQKQAIIHSFNLPGLPTFDWDLAWGPVVHESNLMFVARCRGANGASRSDGHRYAVAIRGTEGTAESILQDVELRLVDLPWQDESAPAGTKISHGIRKAFRRLLAMRDDGLTASEFLSQRIEKGDCGAVDVTGHSLGGCLTTVMALYLANEFPERPVRPLPFAGQTAGNAPFATWYATKFGGNARWFNHLDVVPRAWSYASLDSIKSLYPGGPACHDEYRTLVDVALLAAGHCFFQPGSGTSLPGKVYDKSGLGAFVKEIAAQHSHSYYMYLCGIGTEAIRALDPGWNPPQ